MSPRGALEAPSGIKMRPGYAMQSLEATKMRKDKLLKIQGAFELTFLDVL